MSLWVTAAQVRSFANIDTTTGRYADAVIGSNILAAQEYISQKSGRQFDATTGSRKFTTENRAQLSIPDLRSVVSVTLNGSALTADETYWLLPDRRYPTIYTAIQLRGFGRNRAPWYLGVPDWWDRGLDMEPTAYETSSLPNDLVIESNEWGWATLPSDVLHATKVLAAWLTKRADAMLGNAVQTPDGSIFDYSQYPPEVNAVIETYRGGEQVVAIY